MTGENGTQFPRTAGIRSAQQARGNADAADLELTPADIAEIEDHLVPEAA